MVAINFYGEFEIWLFIKACKCKRSSLLFPSGFINGDFCCLSRIEIIIFRLFKTESFYVMGYGSYIKYFDGVHKFCFYKGNYSKHCLNIVATLVFWDDCIAGSNADTEAEDATFTTDERIATQGTMPKELKLVPYKMKPACRNAKYRNRIDSFKKPQPLP